MIGLDSDWVLLVISAHFAFKLRLALTVILKAALLQC